jgi:hypothetical protein
VLGGATPAGSSRSARLDPLALPVRFAAKDAAADGNQRFVEIDRERVLLQRRVRGMAIRVNLPLRAYLGVSVRSVTADGTEAVAVRLEHRDPALAVDLYADVDDAEVAAEWQLWARVLGLPLLVADLSGNLHSPVAHIGGVEASAPESRRRRRNTVKKRRPSIFLRRRAGNASAEQPVHREREIIARN